MRKLVAAAAILLCVSMAGCRWFVPTAIKQETSIVRVDIENCDIEVKSLQAQSAVHRKAGDEAVAANDQKTADDEYGKADDLARQAAEKVLRSYKRVRPHVVNMDNYMQGKDSQGNK
jgi:hypothetical protein